MTTITRPWHLLVRDALAQEFDLANLDILEYHSVGADDDGTHDVEIDEVIDVVANAVEASIQQAKAEAWDEGYNRGYGHSMWEEPFDQTVNPYRDEA